MTTQTQAVEIRNRALDLAGQWVSYYEQTHGMKDSGTCVIGSGISIEYTPAGKRKPRFAKLIVNADIGYQSEQEKFFTDVMARLKEFYPDAKFQYAYGRMD